MLFRQREKAPDIGKDNFRDFYRTEDGACQTTQLRMSYSKPTKVAKSEGAIDGSLKMLGSTFDAQHLGTFIQKSQFASTGTRALKLTEPFNSSEKNQSFFFRNQQPKQQDPVDYLHMNPINHLVAEQPVTKSQYITTKMMKIPEQTFDVDKINYQKAAELKQPSAYLADLKNSKEHQRKYAEWRNEFQDVNRAYRKAKCAYKSGMMGLDTPLVEGTDLYQEEYQQYKYKYEKQQENKVHRMKSLEKYVNSNPALEFNNVQHRQNQPNHMDELLKPRQFPVTNYEMNDQWMRKKSNNPNIDTTGRLFGRSEGASHATSLRAQYLRDQELRGREYNAIGLTKYEFQNQKQNNIAELRAQLAHKKKKIIDLQDQHNRVLTQLELTQRKVDEQCDQLRLMRLKVESMSKSNNQLKFQNEHIKYDTDVIAEKLHVYKKEDKCDQFRRYEKIVAALQSDVQKLANCVEEHKLVRRLNAEELATQQLRIQELESLQPQSPQIVVIDNNNGSTIREMQTQLELSEINLMESQQKYNKLSNGFKIAIQKIRQLCQSVYDECVHQMANSASQAQIMQTLNKLKLNRKDFDVDISIVDSELNQEHNENLQTSVEKLQNDSQKMKEEYQQVVNNREALLMRQKDLENTVQRLEKQLEKQKEQSQSRQKQVAEQVISIQRNNKALITENEKFIELVKELELQLSTYEQTVARQEKKIQTLELTLYRQ